MSDRKSLLDAPYVLPVLLLFGAALRAGYLGSSYCLDDHMSLRSSSFLFTPLPDRFRPLFFSLLYLWRSIGPDTEWWVQLLPFIFSVASLPLAWWVGLKLGGRRLAAPMTLLFAASPLHLDVSAEVRMYVMLPFFALAQFLCYLSYRDRGNPWSLVLSAVLGALGLYAQPLYGMFLIGMFLLLLSDLRQTKFWPVFASFVGTGLLYAPGIANVLKFYLLIQQGPKHLLVAHPKTALFKYLAAYSAGYSLFEVEDLGIGAKFGLREVLHNLPVVLLAAITFTMILVGAVRKLSQKEERFTRNVILSMVVLPIVVPYTLVLLFHRNFTHAQFYVYSIPFVCLLFVKGMTGFRSRYLRFAAIALYSLVIGISLWRFYFMPTDFGRRKNWHQVVAFMERNTSPQTPIIVLRDPTDNEIAYPELPYYAHHLKPSWLPVLAPMDTADAERYLAYLRESIGNRDHVYYLWEASAKNVLDTRNLVLQSLRRTGHNETRLKVNPRLSIYGWDLRRDKIIHDEAEMTPGTS